MSSLSEDVPDTTAARDSGSPDDVATDVAAEIASQLTQGHGQHAAKLLVDSLAQGTWPSTLALTDWLDDALDDVRRARLISAFAHFPCFACPNGTEPCDRCGGSGFTAVAQVCVACVGLGDKRCDFCNGAGLATYNIVPLELRAKVLVARSARAAKYLQGLLAKRPPRITEATAARYLKDVNKLLGVLENAVVAADQLANAGVLPPQAAAQMWTACRHRAEAADIRTRETLQRLSRFYEDHAGSLAPVDAENARAKADFYSSLAQSQSFEGTGIAHPFLSTGRAAPEGPA